MTEGPYDNSKPKGLFESPQDAVDSIQASKIDTDLKGTTRRAIRAVLWLGAHFGYYLSGMPELLRAQFVQEIDHVLQALAPYNAHYPARDEADFDDNWVPSKEGLSDEQILAVDYRHLSHFLRVAGLKL